MPQNDIYSAAIYLRLSKEDCSSSISATKTESNSITNQRELAMRFIKQHPDIHFVKEYVDDGFSGTNFDRPAFQSLLDDIRANRINCVIVKDLSRFGRDYIDAGKYVEKVFPQLGVRFIAINDNYDSADRYNGADFILPFKNLINDSYSRDISTKIRSHLEIRRQNGELVANHPPYGYLFDSTEHRHFIIDEQAASVVRDIFRMKLDGSSASEIATYLNSIGVPSPAEYKRAIGSNYATGFQSHQKATWCAKTVLRILSNETYIGTLIQGKRTTPNHKIRTTYVKDESLWARQENAHEAIIEPNLFYTIQSLLSQKTHKPPKANIIYPLSGYIFCADCGSPLIRKKVPSGQQTYSYYVCSGNKKNTATCSPHRIRVNDVEAAVLATLQLHINLLLDLDAVFDSIQACSWEQKEIDKITTRIQTLKADIEKDKRLKVELYEDFSSDLIDRSEYDSLRVAFNERIEAAEGAIKKLSQEKLLLEQGSHTDGNWFSQFRKYKNLQSLTRNVVVHLIKSIKVDQNKEVHITLQYNDMISNAQDFLQNQEVG